MNKYIEILKIVTLLFGGFIIFCILTSGCEKIKCSPQFKLDGTYTGIKCGGDW